MLPVPMMGCWSPYVVDIEDQTLFVMDPCETLVYDNEMRIKHEDNAELVLDGLHKCIQANIAGWYVLSTGWKITSRQLRD